MTYPLPGPSRPGLGTGPTSFERSAAQILTDCQGSGCNIYALRNSHDDADELHGRRYLDTTDGRPAGMHNRLVISALGERYLAELLAGGVAVFRQSPEATRVGLTRPDCPKCVASLAE